MINATACQLGGWHATFHMSIASEFWAEACDCRMLLLHMPKPVLETNTGTSWRTWWQINFFWTKITYQWLSSRGATPQFYQIINSNTISPLPLRFPLIAAWEIFWQISLIFSWIWLYPILIKSRCIFLSCT